MAKVVSLKVHKNKRIREQRRSIIAHLKATAKTIPDDIDGWALVAFRRRPTPDGTLLANITDYEVVDPVDLAMLPQLALMLLNESILKNIR